MNNQRKKLTLNKETLRDLTPQNATGVKGGTFTLMDCQRTLMCQTLGCTYTCHHCHGKTYNKKCRY